MPLHPCGVRVWPGGACLAWRCACLAWRLFVTSHKAIPYVSHQVFNHPFGLAYLTNIMHTHTCTHTYMYTHTCTHIHAHTYVHTHIHAHTHTCTHTYVHTHIHTHTHTTTHTGSHIRLHTFLTASKNTSVFYKHTLPHILLPPVIHTHSQAHIQPPLNRCVNYTTIRISPHH